MMGSQLQRAQHSGAGAVSIPHNLLVLMCKGKSRMTTRRTRLFERIALLL